MPADICPAKPLAKGPFPLESPCLASVTAGTRPRPWTGLCWVLGDAVPCPTAPALPLGQVAVACQVMCSRATPKYFINIFYRNILLQYFITLFYHNILSQYFRSSLRCYLTRPRRPRVAANPAVALLWGFKPGFRSERGLCNPPCEAFVFPSLLPTKYLEPADRSRLEKREEG